MMDILQTQIAANTIQTWLIASVAAVVIIVAIGVTRCLVGRHLRKIAEQRRLSSWVISHAVVRRTKWLFVLFLGLFGGSLVVKIPDATREIFNTAVIVVLLIQVGLWLSVALQVAVEQYRQRQLEKDPASVTTLNVLNFIGKISLWVVILLLVLDNLGVNITALVAGLGVGGIAIALAVQTILSDLFASLSIVLDKPFVVGDFLIVGDLLGSVEHVGLKTTRLRSLSGEQLVFSNSDLLNSRIRNYGRMFERRVSFDLGVTYQTSREKLLIIPEIIREAVEKQEQTRFDRSHFKEYGDSALIYESVYFVLGSDYNQYMDIQQAINLHIHERFEREGIEFAYPTRSVFVKHLQ
ncbi:MAG: mechanosensitive ion channel family protein [Gammaproteobacteria bacterium]|nr:mechanosensitive ion channel family protein [Gammaproteobacteria bacterium]